MKPWVLKGKTKRKEDIKMRGRISFVKKCLVLASVGIFCLAISFEEIMAQEKFPERAIKAIVGFTPGGTTDLNARMLAGLASEYLGQPVVALVIVRDTHNYSLKWKVHAVNFKTNEVRSRLTILWHSSGQASPCGLFAMTYLTSGGRAKVNLIKANGTTPLPPQEHDLQ